MPQSTCTLNGCGNPHRAKGLCSTHYNHANPSPKRRAHVERQCVGCGTTVIRESRYRSLNAHCSELCRQWSQFGPWSSTIPRDHISRWVGCLCDYTPKFWAKRPCGWCGNEFGTHKPMQMYCTPTCKKRQSARQRRARQNNAHGTYTAADLTRLWLLFGKACAYCGTPTARAEITADHVKPLARCGTNDPTNLLPCCRDCNSDKRDLSLTDWQADRERRNLPPVTTTWSQGDRRYAHLTAAA